MRKKRCFLPDTNWFRSCSRNDCRSQSFNRSIRLYHVWLVRQSGQRSNRWKVYSPNGGIPGEGLSYYFAEPQDYIKIKNTDKLAEFFKERKLPYVQGRVWTTDSMLRETVNLVRKRKEEGCIAVEMELAGVQAISDFYGFELYDFLVAGDVLIEGNYETDGLSAANHDLDKLFLALQIAKSV